MIYLNTVTLYVLIINYRLPRILHMYERKNDQKTVNFKTKQIHR